MAGAVDGLTMWALDQLGAAVARRWRRRYIGRHRRSKRADTNERMFDTGQMAGGMGKGKVGGVPIGQRPVYMNGQLVRGGAEAGASASSTTSSSSQLPRRHVWVTGPDDSGPHPGLVLQWERRGAGPEDWWALAVWVVVDEAVTVQQWLPAKLLRPA